MDIISLCPGIKGGQCLKIVQGGQCPETVRGEQCPKMLREDNVQREIMSICFRESNTNNRSRNQITREANGKGVIMTICFRGCNVREDFFSRRTIFREDKVSGSTSSLSPYFTSKKNLKSQ